MNTSKKFTLKAFGVLLGLIVLEYANLSGIIPTPSGIISSKVSYAHIGMRYLSEALTPIREKQGTFPPNHAYWGPLGVDLMHQYGIDSRQAIDPFNRSGPRSTWRAGDRFIGDKGCWIRVRGGDFHYCTDGKDFALLFSFGPDEKMDLTSPTMTRILQAPPEQRLAMLNGYTYDPSNGSASNGDIIRQLGY